MPKVSINAVLSSKNPNAIDVSWSSPGAGNVFAVSVVGSDGTFQSWKPRVGTGSAAFTGVRGKTYWFWASVTTDLGWKDANGSQLVHIEGIRRAVI